MKLPFNIQPKRTELCDRAIKIAKRIYDGSPEEYKDTMFCPYCGQPLVKSGKQRRMETLSEHVSNPNGTPSLKDEYICSAEGLFDGQYFLKDSDDDEPILGCEFGVLHAYNGGWEKGGSYVSEYWHQLYDMKKESIINKRVIDQWFREDSKHEAYAALNCTTCEFETSIYKRGLPEKYRLPAWLTLNIIQLTIDMDYKANSWGEVIGTYATLGFNKKDSNSCIKGFCIVGTWPWKTWSYLNYRTKDELSFVKEITNEKEKAKKIAKAINISGNDAWIYRLHQWYEYIIHPKYAKLLKKYGMYKKPSWNID